MNKKLKALVMASVLLLGAVPAQAAVTNTTKITVNKPTIAIPEAGGEMQEGKRVTLNMSCDTDPTGCAVFITWYSESGRYLDCSIIKDSFWRNNSGTKKYESAPAVTVVPEMYPVKAKVFVWTSEGSVIPVSNCYVTEFLDITGIMKRDLPTFTTKLKYQPISTDKGKLIKNEILEVCEDLQIKLNAGIEDIDKVYLETTYKTQIDEAKGVYKTMTADEKAQFTQTLANLASEFPELRDCLLQAFGFSASDFM